MQRHLLGNNQATINRLFVITSISILLPFYINVFVLFALILYLFWLDRKHLLNSLLSLRWTGVFILYSFVVAIFNNNTLGMLVPIAFILYAMLFLYYRRYITTQSYISILKVITVGSIFLGIWAIIEYSAYVFSHGYDLFYIFKYANVQTRAEASFFNANYYGMFCIFAVLVTTYLMYRIQTKRWYLIGALAFLMNGISIILTASRFLLPTIIISLIWLLYWLDKRWARVFLILALIAGGILIAKPELLPRLESLDYAFQDRFNLWSVGWAIFLSHPLFGRGALSYMSFYYLYIDSADMHAHSLYINILANYGLVGLVILAFVVWPYIKILVKQFQIPAIRPEVALITSFILTVLVHGIMDVAIFWVQTAYIFLVVIMAPTDILRQVPANIRTHRFSETFQRDD